MKKVPDMAAGQKKRIGILTFHRAVNYGAALQAYALKRTLDAQGCEASVVDYRNNDIEKTYGAFSFGAISSLRSIAAGLANIPVKLIKNHKFHRFCRSFLDMSPACRGSGALNDAGYDGFVTGSDQVWNYSRSGFDTTYFLDFAPGKKYAYAASFGFDALEESYKARYAELLSGYNIISVREAKGAEIIRNLTGEEAEVVLDPTLLLDKKDWLEVAGRSSILKRLPPEYILLYVFELTASLREFVLDLSKKTGMKIVWVQAALSQRLPDTLRLFTASPEDFVALVAGAGIIVTNSFHGTAFAINLEKEFYTELLPEKYGVNSRIEHILGELGLTGRLIRGGKSVREPVGYAAAFRELRKQREKSLEIVKSISKCMSSQ